ncbi:MAG: ABC transporter ATP-binding protein [Calditrichales bacterium]|nr:MAG: ABC transporter ATP-binding protein [Calditrichales bacterium]
MIHSGDNTPVIRVKGVHKSFKTVQAVRGIDLSVEKGQFVALLGPNGAGKTTLVEMIEGILKPDSGEIRIMGKAWQGHEDELHRVIGLSLQETRFIDKLTVIETLRLFASFYDCDKDRVSGIIDLVGLADKIKSYVVNLSGGQRQRLALGIALINDPKILLLDEPTTGLDPNARREIWLILQRLKQQGQTSLILTTHYMEEAEQLCDHIIIIDHGRILKEGSVAKLLDEDSSEKLIEFTLENSDHYPPAVRPDFPYSVDWNKNNTGGKILFNEIEKELPDFLTFLERQSLRLKSLECRRKTLDDLFISLTGRRLDA